MRRTLSLLLAALSAAAAVRAQRLDITLTDNSVVSYDIAKIQYMEVMPEAAPGQVSGYWYLGYRTTSTSSIHYNGTEKLSFNGTVLKWTKDTGENVYDLEYAENMKSFRAVPRAGGTATTYTIVANEAGLLVLKQGTILRYFYKSMTEATDAELVKFPNRSEYTDTAKVIALKGGDTHSSASVMGTHFAKFPAATEEDKAWLANPANEPTIVVNDYNKWVARTIDLYPFGDPQPADVNQHAIGDCCMCAVFASMAYIYPGFIKNIVTKKSNTVFEVKMFDPQGNPLVVAVSNKLLCNASNSCAQVSGKNGKFTWSTVMEKALMKWNSRFGCDGIGGIATEHSAPPFTGCGDSFSFSPGRLFNGELCMAADYGLRKGYICVGGFNKGGLLCGTLETVTAHAFTLMYTSQPDSYRFSMRNPWGITACDGVLEIPDRREIMGTMDFRFVAPGAAALYKRADLGGYIVPAFTPSDRDMYLSPEMLQLYHLKRYGPSREVEVPFDPDAPAE